ncbi:OmpA family protein [Falsiroseomonas sp. E2-1-a20]|uniref:OmpA family protein n=1 Tax=Falsiroseomonas sp. E2-1-a20 TaxID=3239300 RepID=UPI003F38B01F
MSPARLACLLVLLAAPALAETRPPACLFPRGGDTPDAACLELLGSLAEAWKAAPGRIRVEGHAQDQQGPRLDGLLSRRRAVAVAEALEGLGVPPGRIEAVTPPAEQRDLRSRIDPFSRRAEIHLLP